MRFGRLFPALSVFVAAGALIVLTGTGAAAPQPGRSSPAATTANLAAPAALDATLRSLGVNRASLVTQRGARNYAGPNCPGKGWNCTTSTRVLQISSNGGNNGQNRVECKGATPPIVRSPDNQSCTFFQTGNNNSARCEQRSNSSDADQNCSITQFGKKNVAYVDQSVNASGSDEQSATQTADVTQGPTLATLTTPAGTQASNKSDIDQSVKQSTGRGGGDDDDEDDEDDLRYSTQDDDDDDDGGGPPAAPVQTQDAHQSALVDQDAAGSGDNHSRVKQSERMSAKGGTTQDQNTLFGTLDCVLPSSVVPGSPSMPNVCANISQTSETGKNASGLKQSISEFASSKVATRQQQGNSGEDDGGIDARVHQKSDDGGPAGRSSSDVDQDKRQRMSGPGGQQQYDPISCCGFGSQDGGTGNHEEIKQSSTQDASDPDVQESLLNGSTRSDGTCSVRQRASINGEEGGNSHSDSDAPCEPTLVTTSCFGTSGDDEDDGGSTPPDCTENTAPVEYQCFDDGGIFCFPNEGGCEIGCITDGGGLNTRSLGRQNR